MIDLDLLAVLLVMGGAIALLARRLFSKRTAPACHAARRPGALEGEVVVGAALARGLRAAHARRRR